MKKSNYNVKPGNATGWTGRVLWGLIQKGQAAERANTLKEKERADKKKQRADSEKARADKIEAEKQSMQLEIERLKRLLEKGQE